MNVYVCSGCLRNLSGINERDRKIEEDLLHITENKRDIKDGWSYYIILYIIL